MTQADLRALFIQGTPIFVGGSNYAKPTTAWLTGPFWQWFKAMLWDEDLDKWTPPWECRDFARAYACLAQVCNARTAALPAGMDALAVGEFWFHPDGNPPLEDHAICACVTEEGLIFIEPQTGLVRPVSPNELLTCKFARF